MQTIIKRKKKEKKKKRKEKKEKKKKRKGKKKATSKQQYQYVVLSKSDTFDETKANWKTVKSATTVTLKSKKAVTGSKIYVRVKGVSPDRNKNTAAELPSVTNTTFEIPAP